MTSGLAPLTLSAVSRMAASAWERDGRTDGYMEATAPTWRHLFRQIGVDWRDSDGPWTLGTEAGSFEVWAVYCCDMRDGMVALWREPYDPNDPPAAAVYGSIEEGR